MATDIMGLFKVIIIIQLFYAFAITGLTRTMPADTLKFVDSFSDLSEDINLEGVSNEVQTSLESQQNVGVIELGALVFYSGNILIDLLLNFAFALPQMLGLLVNGIMLLFNMDTSVFAIVQIFASVAVMALYFISLIQLLTNVRSGRAV